ncbi:MAG TPA: hypothetical protein VGF52_04465 [Tepidisphaeraceae bacterium]|jgi:hypothetical protein
MRQPRLLAMMLALLLVGAAIARADYPKPSPYPIAWEFKFDYQTPQRIVVKVPGTDAPQTFWYLTYTVTNNSDKEQMFLPIFEMLTRDGTVIRSDNKIPPQVFDAIKRQEKKPFLESFPKVEGELRLGEDQARDGVAIWPEPSPRMGQFSIFVGGLSGETAQLKDSSGQPVKDKDGNPVILRKTLQLNYIIRGDGVYPGDEQVNENPKDWVMR